MFAFGPLTYLLGGVALVSLLGAGLQTYRLNLAQRDVAIAHQHQAEAEGTAFKVNEIFAREEAKRERDRADQQAKSDAERMALRNELDRIETRFKNVSADRAKTAAENTRFKNNAPKTDSRLLGPTMVRVINCLRLQQQAARAGGVAPPCGNS